MRNGKGKAKRAKPEKLSRSRRKKGKLGRILKVKDHCYAAPVLGSGGCSADFSEEHPLSQALRRGKTLEIRRATVGPGAPRRATFAATLPIRQLSARVLCVTHNRALSAADQEAVRFSEVALAERVRTELGLPTYRGRVASKTVNRFLRWHVENL